MGTPYHHAMAHAKKYGGKPEDYVHIDRWFDATKELLGDIRHRSIRHHASGIQECIKVFGEAIINSDGKSIPTQLIAEAHVVQDLGRIPTVQDWLQCMAIKSWMYKNTANHKDD